MTDTQQILEKLMQDHVGKHNAVTQAQLADALGANTSTVRSELRRLREQQNIPIGNLRDGYFIIASKGELREYVAHINQEIESKRNTIKYTTEAFENFDKELPADNDDTAQSATQPTYECAECGGDVPKSEARYLDGEPEPVCKRCYGEQLIGQ